MKISDIISESELQEGPVLNKIGSAIGKGVGTAAKAAGAVAGGVAGLGSALKKGYQAGKSTVASAGDDEEGNVQLSPAAQKALTALKSLTPADQKATIAALQAPAKPTAGAAPAKSGAAAPSATTTPSGNPKIEPKVANPAAGTAPSSGAAAAAPASGANKANSDSFEKAKSNIRTVQGGEKPIPSTVAQGIQADLAKLAKGDKESGVFAAQKIMNFAKAGYDVSKLQPQWTANAKAGERFLTQSVYYAITKMLREHGLGWADLGLRIRLVESTTEVVGVNYI